MAQTEYFTVMVSESDYFINMLIFTVKTGRKKPELPSKKFRFPIIVIQFITAASRKTFSAQPSLRLRHILHGKAHPSHSVLAKAYYRHLVAEG